jgi:hypothetical protein
VWLALLNMEHKYGSMETLETAFARAVAESKVRVTSSDIHLGKWNMTDFSFISRAMCRAS